ncbi:polynucleotide adenylyltransferase [Malaciobacter molluscorum]|uniref:CCA tRNA nucleotidyltransferase n=1 Tax=Malaciobacter molluscorum TaxID=1032072 RepID=UPI00100A8CD5|nr:CCA tRNA nucleotidyltransferase [Malaciobacter molluscorum]RXJ94445.1 polynucleotide adenylyltransferase [Malaciobacter molluscorum]
MYTFTNIKTKLPKILIKILHSLQEIGAKPILVGGCIRDYFLDINSKDYDIEIFNIDKLEKIQSVLSKYGNVKLVGKSFGVLTLSVDNFEFDFALAREEKKVSSGHKGFEVVTSKNMSFEQASLRRDFTINSIGYDYFEDKILDPHNGLNDLKNGILRYVNKNTFEEDALRVYRAVQFCSRFNLKIEEKTFTLCQRIVDTQEFQELPKERVFEEFKKLFLKSTKPSIGFELLRKIDILKYFPEIKNLIGCIQDKQYHPEGDVWIHTLMCIDELARILDKSDITDEYRKLYLFYSILCHDLGKPFCTQEIKGRITSHKHESLGVEPTKQFLSKITNEKKFIEKIIPLVKNHLAPFQLYLANSSLKAVKRLSLKVNIEDLCYVCLADCLGRDIKDKEKCPKAIDWLLTKAKELNIQNSALKPLVQGKDLINLGFKPSKEFKEILDFAMDLQIDENLTKDEILVTINNKYK